jgi:hypothetical protein
VCPYCGHDYRVAMAGPAAAQKKESSMPLVAGILIILGSLIYLIAGGVMIAGGAVVWDWTGDEGSAAAVACGAIILVMGVLSILGGIFAIQKKNFALALIAGILTIPSILGLIGMILVIVAKDEFA